MKGARGWIIAGSIGILIAAAAYLLQPHNESPEHSSNSDAANGTSAALLFAQAMGHPAGQMTGGFHPPDSLSVLFVFTPTSPYTAEEADQLREWVRARGGTLIYASEHGDPELDRALGVTRYGFETSAGTYVATPAVEGVTGVQGAATVTPLDPAPAQGALLRTGHRLAAGYTH